jgi:hypothetical protein
MAEKEADMHTSFLTYKCTLKWFICQVVYTRRVKIQAIHLFSEQQTPIKRAEKKTKRPMLVLNRSRCG